MCCVPPSLPTGLLSCPGDGGLPDPRLPVLDSPHLSVWPYKCSGGPSVSLSVNPSVCYPVCLPGVPADRPSRLTSFPPLRRCDLAAGLSVWESSGCSRTAPPAGSRPWLHPPPALTAPSGTSARIVTVLRLVKVFLFFYYVLCILFQIYVFSEHFFHSDVRLVMTEVHTSIRSVCPSCPPIGRDGERPRNAVRFTAWSAKTNGAQPVAGKKHASASLTKCVYVCMCVCVCEREKVKERKEGWLEKRYYKKKIHQGLIPSRQTTATLSSLFQSVVFFSFFTSFTKKFVEWFCAPWLQMFAVVLVVKTVMW